MPVSWKLRHESDAAFSDHAMGLASSLNLLPLSARILAARDIGDISAFLSPALASLHDPFLLRDMDKAVDRIARALANGEKIAVFGDYDVDGLTATSLLIRFFRECLGAEAIPYIPHRLNEGYGMSAKGIDILRKQGAGLIITVDNGISCLEEIDYAVSLGMDVVVTDHHQPGEVLPRAAAVVNPNRRDCSYPFKSLSGVGVAFKLAHALARHLKKPAEKSKNFLKLSMDLVALGTVADIMPLNGENRVLVSHGLKMLASTRKIGLRTLLKKLDLEDCQLSSEMVGFRIGPRLNAAGRTEDAKVSLDLLLSESEAESQQLVDKLERMNQDRRLAETRAFEEALEILERDQSYAEDRIKVVYGEEWHQGILGIVASKLADLYGLPAIVLSKATGESAKGANGAACAKGSARSVNGFDLYNALQQCQSLLTGFGGHRMAAGLTLPLERLQDFRRAICSFAGTCISPEKPVSTLCLDAMATLDELNLDTLEQMEKMQPYGEGNPEPLLAVMDCQLQEPPQLLKGKHLKLRFYQRCENNTIRKMSGMAFGVGNQYDAAIKSAARIHIAGVPIINEWNGSRSVELNIKDIQPAE